MHRRLLTACLILVLLAVGAAGCGLFEEPEADTPAEQTDTVVALYARGSIEGDVLKVSGTATVPDGALVVFEVGDPTLETAGGKPAFAVGEAAVNDESFAFELPIEGWPGEGVIVWVAFQTLLGTDAEQPAEVIELYGEMGEYIKGDVVVTQIAEGQLRWVETEFWVAR
jgi:hypothetical protein